MGLGKVEDPTFSRQSAHRWRWGCQPYTSAERFSVPIYVGGRVKSRDIVWVEGLGKLEKFNELIGTWTSDLQACIIASQPTIPPLAPHEFNGLEYLWGPTLCTHKARSVVKETVTECSGNYCTVTNGDPIRPAELQIKLKRFSIYGSSSLLLNNLHFKHTRWSVCKMLQRYCFLTATVV
jgi:hypothetical protein